MFCTLSDIPSKKASKKDKKPKKESKKAAKKDSKKSPKKPEEDEEVFGFGGGEEDRLFTMPPPPASFITPSMTIYSKKRWHEGRMALILEFALAGEEDQQFTMPPPPAEPEPKPVDDERAAKLAKMKARRKSLKEDIHVAVKRALAWIDELPDEY